MNLSQVYVGNLSYAAGESSLRDLAAQFGDVLEIHYRATARRRSPAALASSRLAHRPTRRKSLLD